MVGDRGAGVMVTATFFVAGIPQPQGSKTAYVVKGRAVVVDKNPTLLKPWREQVAKVARATWSHQRVIDGAVRVYAVFVLPRGKSVRREAPSVRPDLDKLVRALLDGVTDAGCVWGDDAQVTQLEVEKVYGDVPGVHVVISGVVAGVAVVGSAA